MISGTKHLWQTDKWFRILVIVTLLSLLTGLGISNILGADPNDFGETVAGSPNDILTLDANTTVSYTVLFNSSFNLVGVAATDDLQMHVIDDILPSDLNTTYLDLIALQSEFASDFSLWYEDDGPLSLVLNNTSSEPIDYIFEFRVYNESDRDKFVYYGIGNLFYNLTFICFGIIMIWWVIIPRIPFLRRH
ncbi:MAG: hypothetical protein ACXAE3_07090 [Candidatus Kariarchaeaceae archaeon]